MTQRKLSSSQKVSISNALITALVKERDKAREESNRLDDALNMIKCGILQEEGEPSEMEAWILKIIDAVEIINGAS